MTEQPVHAGTNEPPNDSVFCSGRKWSALNNDERDYAKKRFEAYASGNDGSDSTTVNLTGLEAQQSALTYSTRHTLTGEMIEADFRGCHLSQLTFRDCDLTGADFSGATLEDVHFEGVASGRVNLSRARLVRCEFGTQAGDELATANFECACFDRASMDQCTFGTYAVLHESSFEYSELANVRFDGCKATACSFRGARATSIAYCGKADLRRSVFSDTVFRQSSDTPIFDHCTLRSCDFGDAVFHLADGSNPTGSTRILVSLGSDLADATFRAAHMAGCVFDSAGQEHDLVNACFADANLTGATFRNNTLNASTFEAAHLKDTHFVGCTGHGAQFSKASFIGTTLTEFRATAAVFTATYFDGVTLDGGSYCQCDFSQSSFENSTFDSGVDCLEARFVGVSFRGSRFRSGTFVGCDFTEADFRRVAEALGPACVFDDAIFARADLTSLSVLPGCSFRRARFDDSIIARTCFDGAMLNEASFRYARTCAIHRDGRGLAVDVNAQDPQDGRPDGFETVVEGEFAGLLERSAEARTTFVGADLNHVSFECAELLGAVFREAVLVGADFSSCLLRDADFRNVAGARGALFESAELGTVIPDGAPHSPGNAPECRLPDKDGSPHEWRIRPAYLARMPARYSCFAYANLNSCDLSGGDFSFSTFENARMCDCDLSGTFEHATMDGADVSGALIGWADFTEAHWVSVANFACCRFTCKDKRARPDRGDTPWGARFAGAYIQATGFWSKPQGQKRTNEGAPEERLDPENVRSARWAEFVEWMNAPPVKNHGRANWVSWKNNFESLGLYDEQSECCRQERVSRQSTAVFQRIHGRERLHPILFACGLIIVLLATVGIDLAWKALAPNPQLLGVSVLVVVVLAWVVALCGRSRAPDCGTLLWDVLYGFGERPWKILGNALATIVVCAGANFVAIVYGWGSVGTAGAASLSFDLRTIGNHLYYSAVTFTTLGDGYYIPDGVCMGIAVLEALCGLALAALFVHTLARRTSGR